MMTRQKGKFNMKTKTTKKAIMSAFENVISVGYCDMQSALTWREPNFYTTGVYGWNADVYVIDCYTVIVTGYRPFGNVKLSRNVIDMLNACAESAKRNLEYHAAKFCLGNNLDELASGIKHDYDIYVFESATERFEIKRT